MTAFHREASELICGADGSHLGGFIEGYEAGFTASVDASLLPLFPSPPFSVQLIAKCANFIRNKPAGSRPGSKLISADVLLQQHQLFPVLKLV